MEATFVSLPLPSALWVFEGVMYLVVALAGTEQADRLWRGGYGGQYAEAAQQPDVLQSAVLLEEKTTRCQAAVALRGAYGAGL